MKDSDSFEYQLEPLREAVDFTLYRGRERRTDMPILGLAVVDDHLSSHNVQRLEHEYSLATELDGAWAAQPLALTRYQGHPILILKNPGGEPLDSILKQHGKYDVTRFLRVAIGLAAAAGQLHRQGLIHKDIKPANVLADASGQAWLTGFGIASRLPRERQLPAAPEYIAGSLPYMAPEQTGRMNRSMDSRSDLYSLGVTLYEVSTGTLPFTASDPMEWIHCQIARQPASPCERSPHIPVPVSAIIMKLLAKSAEERYQTALGLERDLRQCLEEWVTHGRIDDFLLGSQDKSDRLLIPENLYGRTAEIRILRDAFDRVLAGGRPELVLVSGYSGVGKSSVVNELHKALVPPRGLFASGKFDQYKRDIPYATLAQAFQSLIHPILAKDESELGLWRDEIRDALGPNGQLMVDLVPELKLIIGEQAPVPELPAQDAQSRFQLVLRRFIDAFTRHQPLALFLDDLQWLDAATLDLMEDLLTHPEVKDLLLIGAYRDNEVGTSHPLMRRLESIRRSGSMVHDIVLGPLSRHDLEALVADSLHCERARSASLAAIVDERTRGNPFFAIQFFSALAEESLLTFDYGDGQWSWNPERIRAKGYTDNVVDLVVAKLSRLSVETQTALQQLACLGNSADFATLYMICQDPGEIVDRQLWIAERAGLIFRSADSYRFLHDRVQEAAYSLIPRELRAETHLRIGMSMVSRTPPDKLEEVIFEIVNQLNRGAHQITSAADRERVAGFNLIAGRRAKSSTAYASAMKYLGAARALLTDETWARNYDLVFSIETMLAECELLTANMPRAEDRLSQLAERAKTAHHVALVARLRVTLYILLGSHRGADVFIEYQGRLGRNWSAHPTNEIVAQEYDRVMSLLKATKIADLVDLPLATNPDVLDELGVLAEVVMTAIFTDANFLALVLCRMVALSLEHGNCDASCFAFVSLGMLAWSRFGDPEVGFQFGKLGYDLVERHGLHRYRARVYLRFALCIMPWRQHLNTGRALIRRAFDAANTVGDLTFAAYSCNFLNTHLLAAGDPLADVQREAEKGLEFAEKARFLRVIDQITTQLGLIRTLRGLTTKFGSFDDEHFDELQFERHLSSNSTLAVPECWYWIRKLQARFFSGDYSSAIQASSNAGKLLWACDYYFEAAEYHFYGALARAAAVDQTAEDTRQEHLQALANHHRQLAAWAETGRETFEDRAALVGAEMARVEGRDLDAMSLYEEAIRSAGANGFVHNEAVANELAGRFYLSRGIINAGQAYLRSARSCYVRWGAAGKVKQLDERHPRLREERAAANSSMNAPPIGQLDVNTVVKASQALSGEIVLPRLIERLMRITVEHAGANRGLLILLREGEARVEAEATTGEGSITVAVGEAIVRPSDLPQTALHYAIRTRERVLLDDATADAKYSGDEYVRWKRAKSVLCLPIVKQTTLVGVLYLENTLTPGAFTPDRVTVLQLLASQAAISLENAALYGDLQLQVGLLQRLPVSAWTLKPDGTPDFVNQVWLEFAGQNLDFVRSHPEAWMTAIHPDDREKAAKNFWEGVYSGQGFAMECRLLRARDGTYRWHLNQAVVLRDAEGNAVKFVGTTTDIDDQKRTEEALRQAQGDLARINRATIMGELAASLAHELSQPISGAMTNANTCLRKLGRDEPDIDGLRVAVTRIARDAQRASDIIGRIRAQFKKGTPNREILDVNEINRETVALLRDEAARYNISMRTMLAADPPQIVGDRVQLQQVAMNLIVNGIEAMKDVEGAREMVIQSRCSDNQQIVISFSDTGMGFPPELAEQMFDPFFTTKPHGTGMGLRISRSIIESHSGRLWAVGNPGRGATFHCSLPAALRVPRSSEIERL